MQRGYHFPLPKCLNVRPDPAFQAGERVINVYSKVNNMLDLVMGIRQLLIMFDGDLTASIPRKFPPGVNFSDAEAAFTRGAAKAMQKGLLEWTEGYVADYLKGKKLTDYVVYLPTLFPQRTSLVPSGLKINGKPVKVGLGAPSGKRGSLFGIGVVMGGEKALFRMDIGLTPSGHITGRGGELDTFDEPPFSFHVYSWSRGGR